MTNKINLRIIKEQKHDRDTLNHYCPDLEDKISIATQNGDPNLNFLKSLRSHCEQHRAVVDAERTVADPKSDPKDRERSRRTLQAVIEENKIDAYAKTFLTYYNHFRQEMADFQFGAADTITGQDPDVVQPADKNDCFWQVGTHAGRAAAVVGTYVIANSLFGFVTGPGFRNAKWSWARTPFRAVSELYEKGAGQYGRKNRVSREELNAAARSAIGDGMGTAASRKKAAAALAEDGWVPAIGRGAVGGTRGALRIGAWGALAASVGALVLYPDDKGNYSSDAVATMDGIFTLLAVQDWAPKILVADTIYPGGQQGVDAKDPCTYLGPFFAGIAIAALRSRSFAKIAPTAAGWAKYGFVSKGAAQQAKQLDWEKYFQTIATRTGRAVDDAVDSFGTFLGKKIKDFTEQFVANVRRQNLYPNVPDEVQDVYVKWAQKQNNIHRGLDDLASRQGDDAIGLHDDLLAAWGKNAKEITDAEFDDLIFFMKSYNAGISEVTEQASKRFHNFNLRKAQGYRDRVTNLSAKAKSAIYKLFKAGDTTSAADDLAPLAPREVRSVSPKSADEAAELLDTQYRAPHTELESLARNSGATQRSAAARAGGREGEDTWRGMLDLALGNPTPLLVQCDDAADALRLHLDELFEDAAVAGQKSAGDKMSTLLGYLNRNKETRTVLIQRIFKKYFPDEVLDDAAAAGARNADEIDVASTIYNNLMKKFGSLGDDAKKAAIRKELDDMVTTVQKETGEYVKKTWIAKFGRESFDVAFRGGVFQTVVAVTTLLTAAGILWGFYATEKVKFTAGEDGYYYVGNDLISSGAAELFNSWGGRRALKQVSIVQKKLQGKLAGRGASAAAMRRANKKIRKNTFRKFLLPPDMSVGDLIENPKIPLGFRGRINFWKTLVDKPSEYKGMDINTVYDTFLIGVQDDMKYMQDTEAGDPESVISEMASKDLNQPEVRNAISYQYGNSNKLKEAISGYLRATPQYKRMRVERIDEIFGHGKAGIYASDNTGKKIEKTVAKVNEKTDEAQESFNRDFTQNFMQTVNSFMSTPESGGISLLKAADIVREIKFLDAKKLTKEHKSYLNQLIGQIDAHRGLSSGERKIIKRALQKKIKQIKENRQMEDNKLLFLQNIVREVISENYGQGYSQYPYHSNVGNEEEEAADFIEDWKAFELSVVRDETRDTAVQLAKILVKDLELFGDVVDLVGKNQSVATEILKKMKESEGSKSS